MPGIAQAIQAKPRTAPKQWSPKGELKNTEYAKSLRQNAGARGPGGGPSGPTPAAMPWDSAYETSVSGAHAKYNNALAGIGASRLTTQQEFGLDPGFNDFQSNPFSRAAQLERSFRRSNRGSMTSMGSAGHLYSGSLQNQLGYNRTNRDVEYNDLKTAYQNALADLQARERAAEDEMHGSESEAAWKRVEAAEREPLDTSTVAPGSGPGGYRKTKKGAKYGVSKGRKAR